MKNLIAFCLALAFTLSASAQSSAQLDKLYNSYSSGEGIMSFTLNKEMLDAVDLDFDWKEQLRHLDGDIYQLRMITFSEKSNPGKQIASLQNELHNAGLRPIEIPEHAADGQLEGEIQLFAHQKGQYYDQVYLLLLSDDRKMALFVAINGKLTLSKA